MGRSTYEGHDGTWEALCESEEKNLAVAYCFYADRRTVIRVWRCKASFSYCPGVCRNGFMRMRPVALRASALSNLHLAAQELF